jgi:hypothetical protein
MKARLSYVPLTNCYAHFSGQRMPSQLPRQAIELQNAAPGDLELISVNNISVLEDNVQIIDLNCSHHEILSHHSSIKRITSFLQSEEIN